MRKQIGGAQITETHLIHRRKIKQKCIKHVLAWKIIMNYYNWINANIFEDCFNASTFYELNILDSS